MFPWKTSIDIDKTSATPVYLQVCNAFIREIAAGRLAAGQKIPGSRQMAALLEVNRKTIVSVYDELMAQDWLEIVPAKGTFVAHKLPVNHYQKPASDSLGSNYMTELILEIPKSVENAPVHQEQMMRITDGSPDVRLAPMESIYKRCREISVRTSRRTHLRYGDEQGEEHLRTTLAGYLKETRGLNCTKDQILVTRGSQMGIFLAFQLLLNAGDQVIVGEVSYPATNQVVSHFGGELLTVPVDSSGIDVMAVEQLCKRYTIRAMYLTSHHHYPTTVTLSPERRVRLLQLAQQYHFAIIEDDYDYDFHYASSPVLPLASLDTQGVVMYIGSLTKCIAPAIRTGYMVAHPQLIQAISHHRKLLDRQGDPVLERALSEFIRDGELQRHLKKSLKTYRYRRDYFCDLIATHLGKWSTFRKPDGGMAVWVLVDRKVDIGLLSKFVERKGISLEDFELWKYDHALRLGFASLNEEEMAFGIKTLAAGMAAQCP